MTRVVSSLCCVFLHHFLFAQLIEFLVVFIRSTPIKPAKESVSDDPATMIALALRKRFAQMNQVNDSPEREREERERERDDSFSESAAEQLTPKFAASPTNKPGNLRGPPISRKLFVYTRPDFVAPASAADDKENSSAAPVYNILK